MNAAEVSREVDRWGRHGGLVRGLLFGAGIELVVAAVVLALVLVGRAL